MSDTESNKTIEYQNQMNNAYRQRNTFRSYDRVAATIFKEQYKPADPFDGVLIPAEFLEISELAAVFKAAVALEDKGYAEFIPELIKRRQDYPTPLIRVDLSWLNSLRQNKYLICQYLQKCCFEFDSVEAVHFFEQEIKDLNDSQLNEYLSQAQEALATVEVEVVNEI